MNMRVGAFEVVDSKGVHWLEKYNDEGKKTARKKVTMCMEASEGARGSLSSVCVCGWVLNAFVEGTVLKPPTCVCACVFVWVCVCVFYVCEQVRREEPNPKYTEGGEEPETIKVEVDRDEPAKKCWYCNQFGRERNNHSWACR